MDDAALVAVGTFLFLMALGFIYQKISGKQIFHRPLYPAPSDPNAQRVPCPSCKESVHPEARICPFCKQPIFSHDTGKNSLLYLVYIAAAFLIIYYGVFGWIKYQAESNMERLHRQIEESVRH